MCDTVPESGGEAVLRRLTSALGALSQDVDDAVRIDRITALEELKSAAAAAQARETAAFAASQRLVQAAAGVPADRVGRGIGSQIALARRISPYQAGRYVGWATILTTELPHTFVELARGRTSEWRAMLVARETVFLSREHRAIVDGEIAPRLQVLGDRGVEAEIRKIGYRLDPRGYVERASAAAGDRRVTLRPAPDVMCRLTALLPVAQGVAAYAALSREADTGVGTGDGRGRGQIMADVLVERVTGQAVASDVPVEVNLVMTDAALVGRGEPGTGHSEPAHLDGYGPIPAAVARRLVFDPGESTPRWLRRLYVHPTSGELVTMDSRRRCFTAAQRHFIRMRDQTCRTPWCDAPIRHVDHVQPYEDGGPTEIDNGQGYCVTCNLAKQAPGWQTSVTGRGASGHEVLITTPTGHRYRSRAPRPPGSAARGVPAGVTSPHRYRLHRPRRSDPNRVVGAGAAARVAPSRPRATRRRRRCRRLRRSTRRAAL
jgi:hypothetical protein